MPESKETKTNLDKKQIESLIIQQYKDDYAALQTRVNALEQHVFGASRPLFQEGEVL